MLIKARLKGQEFDLITLAELFREGEPAVSSDAEGYYLSFNESEELFRDGGQLHAAASVLLRRANGVARLNHPEFQPVSLTGRFSDEGGHQHHVVLADTATVRGQAFAAKVAIDGETPPPPPTPGPDYVGLTRTNADAAEVLDILGKSASPGWVELYKVLEIVSKNVTGLPSLKGLPRLKQMGWVPRAQLDAFTASANHQGISGDEARHARMKGTPRPDRMMSLDDARQVIGALATRWLNYLPLSSPPGP